MAKTRDPDGQHDTEERAEVAADRGSLIGIAFAPMLWAGHFLFVYGLAAIFCEKAPQALGFAATIILVSTPVALAGIVLVTWPAWREWRSERQTGTAQDDPEGRRHFLAHASLLLAGLSAFAVVLQSLPALLSPTCG